MPWRFVHQYCQGTGKVKNDHWEYCSSMEKSPGSCRNCAREYPELFNECNKGEIIACEGCNGTGELIIEGEEWGAPEWF